MSDFSKRELLQGQVENAVADIIYYGRTNDAELTREDVDELIESGEVTIGDLVKWFTDELIANIV